MNNFKIRDLIAYKQYNSKGYPAIGITMFGDNNLSVKTIVPSGTSVGSREAIELVDRDKNVFNGKGVDKAINLINTKIKKIIINKNPLEQYKLDNLLIKIDGRFNKSKLGGNVINGISISICKLAAKYLDMEPFEYISKYLFNEEKSFKMPNILVNVINGGLHASNTLDFQEFLIIPKNTKNIEHACDIASKCFYELNKIIVKNKMSNAKGDEGGFDTSFENFHTALDYIEKSIMNAGYNPGKDVAIGIDVAASTFYKNGKYYLNNSSFEISSKKVNKIQLSKKEMLTFYANLFKLYPSIYYLEDPFDENDWAGFNCLNNTYFRNKLIVGDDLYCTNIRFLKKGVALKSSNSIIIKPNQIGTLTETFEVIKYAKKNKIKTIVSHRSGDSEDSFIADFAVGVGSNYIKTGSFSRSERLAKYNRLIEIETLINNKKIKVI